MSHLFNAPYGERSSQLVNVPMRDIYEIIREKLEYYDPDYSDPDAFCQDVCVRLEKKMNIFPNVLYWEEYADG